MKPATPHEGYRSHCHAAAGDLLAAEVPLCHRRSLMDLMRWRQLALEIVSHALVSDSVITSITNTSTVLRPLYRTTCINRHPQLRSGRFVRAKFHCLHALADGNYRIRIRENTQKFSSTVLPAPSLYLLVMSSTTTTVLRPFVLDYSGEPVPEETFTHPPS